MRRGQNEYAKPTSWSAAAGGHIAKRTPSGEMRALYDACDAPWFAGFDPRHFAGGYPEAIAAAGGDAWCMYYRDCTQDAHQESKRFGLESAAWSVNLRDAGELARLVRIGADNLVVDYPDMDLDALRRHA